MSRGSLPALRISRREILVAASTGSLLGGAWGSAFVAGELHTEHPTATLLHSRDSFAMLLESRSRRLLLIDHRGDPTVGIADDVTATLLGLLRRRIDIALVTDTLLQSMGSAWRETWRVGMVAPLASALSNPFDGSVVTLGDLSLSLQQWPSGDAVTVHTWVFTARHAGVALVCGGSWQAVTTATRWPETTLTVSSAVGEATATGAGMSGDIVIVPTEEVSQAIAEQVQARGVRVARLYRDDPLTIELRADGVRLPGPDL